MRVKLIKLVNELEYEGAKEILSSVELALCELVTLYRIRGAGNRHTRRTDYSPENKGPGARGKFARIPGSPAETKEHRQFSLFDSIRSAAERATFRRVARTRDHRNRLSAASYVDGR